jgi:outer membrane protein TolC
MRKTSLSVQCSHAGRLRSRRRTGAADGQHAGGLGRADAAPTAWPTADWWRSFGSDELNRLVVEAQANNLDIAAAAARVDQAEAQLRVTGASLYPLVNFTSNLQQRGPAGDPKLIEGSGSSSSLSSDLGGGQRELEAKDDRQQSA